ncbi:MAG TPA: hypothetical protein VGU44_01505 [Gammaproteobacteria bacterium]|nr:hypothetical protein [Gammaproteobacteria bacterium]
MTITVTAENALLAINRFISSIASDFPEPSKMVSIETETKNNAEIWVYAREELQRWINTAAEKDPMKRPKSPETGEPLDVSTFVNCGDLFSLVLAIVEASGQLETAIKKDDDLRTFAATPDSGFRKALMEGRGLLDSLLKAPGDLKTKMLAVGLPANDSPGQIRLLTHTLGFKPEEFVGHKHPGKELPAYLPPLVIKTEALIPPVAIMHLAQNAMPDPFNPFTPAIGVPLNAPAYNEQAELKRAMEASMQDPVGDEIAQALAESKAIYESAEAEQLRRAQEDMQDPVGDEIAQALAESKAIHESTEAEQLRRAQEESFLGYGNVLAARFRQVEQVYEFGEVKNQEDRRGFLENLDKEIQKACQQGCVDLLQKLLADVTTQVRQACAREDFSWIDPLSDRQAQITQFIAQAQPVRMHAPVQPQPMLAAARAAGVGLDAAPNYEVKELKDQIETDEGFLDRLHMGITTNIARGDIGLLQKMRDRIVRKLEEAIQQNKDVFVGALFECQERINVYINEGRVIPAPVRQPAMLPAASAHAF